MGNYIGKKQKIFGLSLILFCLTIPAFAGENIIWNGADDPDNTTDLQSVPIFNYKSIFPAGFSNNTITINGDVPGLVHGGGVVVIGGDVSNSASGNSVIIKGSATIGVSSGGPNQGAVLGGVILGVGSGSASGDVLDNTVQVTDNAFIYGDVYGGLLYLNPADAGNTITGKVEGNEVTVSGGEIVGAVFGGQAAGHSGTSQATNNRVTVSNGAIGTGGGGVNTGIVGGYAFSTTGTATAKGNVVTISGGEMTYSVQGGYAESDYGTATALENRVTINNGNINANVYGGLAQNKNPGTTGEAFQNTVTINGGTITGWVLGGYADKGASSYNHVEITNGNVGSSGTFVKGGWSVDGESHHNTIFISGGKIDGAVYGGYSDSGGAYNNSVTLSGSPEFSNNTVIYGGYSNAAGNVTGNTLNVLGYTGSSVVSVQNFENYNFVLASQTGNGDTVLSITNGVVELNNTNIAITGVETGSVLKAGDEVTLISATQNTFTSFSGDSARQGALLSYDFEHVDTTTNALVVRVKSTGAQAQAKGFSEGRLAALAFVNQGADFIANKALSLAVQDTQNGRLLTPFAIMGGGKSRYQSGSHINVEGVSALAGLAWGHNLTPGRLTLGAFFEAGWGNYNTHNSFNNAPSVRGDGDTEYYGGGILGRFDFAGSATGGFYTEASARIGSASNDFSSHDLGVGGAKAHYNSNSLYYGLHGGLGYIFNLTETMRLDAYGKLFWTHQNSDSVHIFGQTLKFDAANSFRARLGSRLSLELAPGFTPYGGAAYEYEFCGKAKATAHGYGILTPEIKGGSGIFEVGGIIQPDLDMGLYFDFAAQGYVGKREGLTGSISVGFSF